MQTCNHCHQHFVESTCPHCEASIQSPSIIGGVTLSVLLGVGLTACPSPQALYGAPPVEMDLDGDGFESYEDCDDEDPYTYPGAAYEESEEACMTDFDGDGYGSATPEEWVEAGTDCDDQEPTVNPGAENCPE